VPEKKGAGEVRGMVGAAEDQRRRRFEEGGAPRRRDSGAWRGQAVAVGSGGGGEKEWCGGGERINWCGALVVRKKIPWENIKEEEYTGKKKTCCALWAVAHDADNACGTPLAGRFSLRSPSSLPQAHRCLSSLQSPWGSKSP
jgi:hypothetical protein